ncbi:hypothetical protein pb186bvf_004755 [Paramecium bursaria]
MQQYKRYVSIFMENLNQFSLKSIRTILSRFQSWQQIKELNNPNHKTYFQYGISIVIKIQISSQRKHKHSFSVYCSFIAVEIQLNIIIYILHLRLQVSWIANVQSLYDEIPIQSAFIYSNQYKQCFHNIHIISQWMITP